MRSRRLADEHRGAGVVTTDVQSSYLPLADAIRVWRAALDAAGVPERLPSERISTADGIGRAPASVIRTKYPSPTYRGAAMDGYAVRAADVARASADTPVRLPVGDAADAATGALAIDTGAVVPERFDSVIARERVTVSSDGFIDVLAPVSAGKNVRLPGDDVPPGVAIGWPGLALRPLDCATLLASGVTAIDVVRLPRLAIVPTGDEVVPPDRAPKPGTVIESNSVMIAGEARALGVDVRVLPAVRDDDAALEAALRAVISDADIVAVIAGSSAGRRDRGAAAIARVGAVDVRGVATRPGRPVILGHAGATALVNLPGYPASCHFAFEAYVAPLVRRLGGRADPARRRARLAQTMETDGAFDEFHTATLLSLPGSPRAIVVPVPEIGGGLYQLDRADARFHLKRGIARFGRHAAVAWTPLGSADDASRPVFVGPYDPLLEELAALGGFRCVWTDDETGEALDDGLADAVGVIARDGELATLRQRAGTGRRLLPIGTRIEGTCSRTAANENAPVGSGLGNHRGDPWQSAAAVACGALRSARCTRFVAERFHLAFKETGSALYAAVWEDRPNHRFPWGIVLAAGLSAVASAASALGWKSVGTTEGS